MVKDEHSPVENTAPFSEDHVDAAGDGDKATGRDAAAPLAEDIQAGPSPLSATSLAEDPAIEADAGVIEAAVAEEFEVLEELGNEGLKAVESTVSAVSGNVQTLISETADYSKNCFENRAAFIGALLEAKSLGQVVQLQSSYAKAATARFLAYLMMINSLTWKILGEASRPVEKAGAKESRAKT